MKYQVIEVPDVWPKIPRAKITLEHCVLKPWAVLTLSLKEDLSDRRDTGAFSLALQLEDWDTGDYFVAYFDDIFRFRYFAGEYAVRLIDLDDPGEFEMCMLRAIVSSMSQFEMKYINALHSMTARFDYIDFGFKVFGHWYEGKIPLRARNHKERVEQFIMLLE